MFRKYTHGSGKKEGLISYGAVGKGFTDFLNDLEAVKEGAKKAWGLSVCVKALTARTQQVS